jgi:anti-anti-sigma factor
MMAHVSNDRHDGGHRSRRRPRRAAASRKTWRSGPAGPPATATVTWGVDSNDTTTVDLSGEWGKSTTQHVSEFIEEVADVSPANVAVDMSEVTFIDGRGLSLLLRTQNRLADRGLRCRIVSPSPVVRRLFERVRLEERLSRRFDLT